MDMVKHSQITQNNKFAKPSQYLKKEVRDGVHFLHANKHQICYKLALLFWMEVAKHVQSTQNRSFQEEYFIFNLFSFFIDCIGKFKKHSKFSFLHLCYSE